MTMFFSIPSVSPSAATGTPAHPTRPARLLRNVLSLITKQCESAVPQLFPYPNLSSLPDPAMGTFLNSGLSELGEAMLRQARELSVRLEIDARFCGELPCILTPQSIQLMLDNTVLVGLDAKRRLALTNSRLVLLSEVAALSFETLLMVTPSDMLSTDLNAQTLRTLEIAGVSTNGCTTPGGLYRALCIRLSELEREAMAASLDCLKTTLHLQRLRLLQCAGKFLTAQAERIIGQEFEGSDELPHGMHPSEIALAACAADPYRDNWPSPYLNPDERQSERERMQARHGAMSQA